MPQIIHTPYGQEHPYEQLPEERFPRQPLASQPFTIGIVTRPPGAVQSVRVQVSVEGAAQPPVEATQMKNWRPELEQGVGAEFLERLNLVDQDVWRAQLAAPPAGQTLAYRLEADGQTGESYTVRGEDWQPGGGWRWDEQTMNVCQSDAEHRPVVPAGSPIPGLPELVNVAWLTDGQRARRVRLTFRCGSDEAFFGLGERFNALNQRGNVMDVRCYEQYKNQGQRTYMPIPFLLSSSGYGLYVDSRRWMQFDLAASSAEHWTLEADLGADDCLSLRWLTGSDPLDIISQFTQMTGPAALPPLWSFGLWMSSNEWNTQARVLREAQTSLEHQITPSVMVIEAWSDETTFYIWNDAQYKAKAGSEFFSYNDFTYPADGKWPDPKGMLDWLHHQGIKLILWQVPAMKALEGPHPQHEADRAYFEQSGFGVREADGSLYKVRPFWFRGGYLWDVTNPAAREWWLGKRGYLLDDLGIDGFKTDGGEHLWGAETRFADGRRGDELWNEYPQRYTEAYYQFANQRPHPSPAASLSGREGEKQPNERVVFSRAGFAGSQRAPLHWAGDENSTWDAFRHSILAGLSAGISGIPFWGWDIGGFSGEIPTAELYLRSAAMAAFCPVMQYHSEYNPRHDPSRDRTPWNIQLLTGDERVIPTFRFLVNVRHNLMPYLWQEARHSAQTGQPMMRALRLWHSEASDVQYFLGRDLLVCPVVETGVATWPVFLPPGSWFDLWTKTRFDGGQTITAEAPLGRIPVFARGGTRLPVRLGANGTLGEAVPLSGEANAFLDFGASS